MRRSHPAPHGPPASLKEISCAVSFQRFSSRPLSPFCPWRCSRRARRRRRGRTFPHRARPLRRCPGLELYMEGRSRSPGRGRHRDLDRHDLSAVADGERGRAPAVDALVDRHPAADGDERHRVSLHHRRKPGSRSAGEAPRLARRRGAGYGNRHGGAAAGARTSRWCSRTTRRSGPGSEDDFIAYTWNKFLRTGDERWPARLPMTKSAVRAMDAVTAFTTSPAGGGHAATRFVVSGASKRGWTTWATAAVDSRVIAIAPAVIDLLNIEPSFKHHFQAYGAWSDAVQDYVDQGIMKWLGTPQFKALMRIEEPVRVPRPVDDAEVHHERVGRSVLPARFVAVLLRPVAGREAPALRAERVAFARQDRRARERGGVLCVDRQRRRRVRRSTGRSNGTARSRSIAKDRPVRSLMWQATNPDARNFRQDVIGDAYQSTS